MNNHNADLCRVNSRMLWEQVLLRVSFAAFVALERLHPRVLHHVATQVTRVYASIIALVTLKRLVSSMHPHYVLFHITSVNFRMLWEKVLLRVSFATFVALFTNYMSPSQVKKNVLHHICFSLVPLVTFQTHVLF